MSSNPSGADTRTDDAVGVPLAARLVCFHCSQTVDTPGRWTVRIDGALRETCCAGCRAVAQAIVDAGMEDYYRHRTGTATTPAAVPDEIAKLALYDEPELQQRFVRASGERSEATLMLEGLRCGACVWLIERTLAAQPGVESAAVNFATERAVLRWDPSRTRLSTLLARVMAVGYRALPYDAQQREAQLARTTKSLFKRMFVAGIGMMQVMMYAVPVYTAAPGEIDWPFEQLMRWASFLLTIPVVLYAAQPFFSGALRDLRARSLGMDVPVALGVGAAFAASTWATLTRQGEVYFDSVTMFVFLLLAARYLEWVARRRASRAVDAMAAALPERAERVPDRRLAEGECAPPEAVLAAAPLESVPAARLQPGDLLRVSAGARIPVDATLLYGRTAIDQSLLTGESQPVARNAGDALPGGAINAGPPVWVQVLRASADSTLSTVERLIERAALDKPAIARLADRIASRFVLALLGLAFMVLAVWWWIDPTRAIPIAIAVLVVSCPCALSLATPAALAAATGAATRRGALTATGVALESLAGCTDVVFDKTGTLTEGRPRLIGVDTFDGTQPEQARRLAAALEAGSAHPLANALRAGAEDARGDGATGLVSVPGRGVEGSVDGLALRLGSAAFVSEWATLPEVVPSNGSEVWLVAHHRPMARFILRDTLRADAAAALARLRGHGLRIHLLSGDHEAAVAACAGELDITSYAAAASPADKLAFVRALQAQGRRVLMVGDGINDAPVLAVADASLAVGEATALAKTAADAVLLSSDLTLVPDLLQLARQTGRVIAQNLGWASLYNLVAIPAAALGLVPPWLAAIGMSGSSLLVGGNALRLRIDRPHRRPTAGDPR